jgi:hypothetical protein
MREKSKVYHACWRDRTNVLVTPPRLVAHDRGESRETAPLQLALVILSGCEGKSELWPSHTQVWLLASSPAVSESCGLMAYSQRFQDINLEGWSDWLLSTFVILSKPVTLLSSQPCLSLHLLCHLLPRMVAFWCLWVQKLVVELQKRQTVQDWRCYSISLLRTMVPIS